MTKEERIISIKKRLSDAINYGSADVKMSVDAIIINNQVVIMSALFLLLDEIRIE